MTNKNSQIQHDPAEYCLARFGAVLDDLVREKIDPSYIISAIAKLARTTARLDPAYEASWLECLSASLAASAEVAAASASVRATQEKLKSLRS